MKGYVQESINNHTWNHPGKNMVFLYLIAVLVNVPFCLFLKFPVLGDEYNVISIAATFAGYDWSEYASITKSYHGFGQAIFYTPLFWILDNPVWIYRGMLVVNALLISATGVIAYQILHTGLKSQNERMNIWISLVTGTLPFYISLAKNAWNETMIGVVTILEIMLALFLIQKEDWKKVGFYSLLLGIVTSYGYMVHSRMLVFAIVYPVFYVMLLLLRRPHIPFKQMAAGTGIFAGGFGAGFSALWFVTKQVKTYLYNHLWHHEGLNSSVGEFVDRKIDFLLDIANWKTLVKAAIGQIYYMTVTPYGMVLLGLVLAFVVLLAYMFRSKKHPVSDTTVALSILLLLSYMGTLALSVISLISGILTPANARVDYMIYGRYTENVYPVLILFALYMIFQLSKKQRVIVCLSTTLLFIGIGFLQLRYVYPLYITLNKSGYSSITNLLPFTTMDIIRGDDERIRSVMIFSIILMLIVFIVVQFCILKDRRILLFVLMLVLSAYSFLYTVFVKRYSSSVSAATGMTELSSVLEDTDIQEACDQVYLLMQSKDYPTRFQFALSDYSCSVLYSIPNYNEIQILGDTLQKNSFLISETDIDLDYYYDDVYEIQTDSKYYLWVIGDEMAIRMASKGNLLLKDEDKVLDIETNTIDEVTDTGVIEKPLNKSLESLGLRFRPNTWHRSEVFFLPEGTYRIHITGENLDGTSVLVSSVYSMERYESTGESTIRCEVENDSDTEYTCVIELDQPLWNVFVAIDNLQDRNAYCSGIQIEKIQ